MNTEEGKSSNLHGMFAVACIIQGSVLLSSFVAGISKQDTWIVVIGAFLVSLLLSGIYIALVKKFPGKTLVEMNDIVFGKAMGKVLSVAYFFFFLTLSALNCMDVGNFVSIDLLFETPKAITTGIFVFVCVWALKKGVVNIMRYSVLFCVSTLAVIFLSTLLQLKEFNLQAFLPILTLPPIKYVQAVHIMTAIPFLETVGFLMIFPRLNNQGDVKKVIFGGLSIGALTLLMVVVRDIGVLGNMTDQFTRPTYESLHLINVGDILTRMELLFSALFIILLFYKVTILFYATVKIIEQVFGLKQQKHLVSVTGALIVIYALIVFDSGAENAVWASTTAPFFSILFEVIFPLLTLIAAAVRIPSPRGEGNET